MKKMILRCAVSLLAIATAHAHAQEEIVEGLCFYEDNCAADNRHFYLKIFAGPNFLQDTSLDGNQAGYETGYMVAGSIGYCWCGLCLEGEYAFRKNDIEKILFVQQGSSNQGYIETSSYMANLIWDLPLCDLPIFSSACRYGDMQPFMGAGIGYDRHQMHAENSRVIFDQKWEQFSWQLMAGVAYSICCNTDITLEYKFHQGGSQFNNHVIGLGLAYRFGI